MFVNVQIDEDEINEKLQKKLLWMLAITGCAANMAGFLSNAALFGMSFPTLVCGVCEAVMIVCSIAALGWGKQKIAIPVMVLTLALVEFPFLYYVYGASMGVYLVLGIAALAVYFSRPYHVPAIALTVLLDAAVILFSYYSPSTIEEVDPKSQMQTMLCSYLIVAATLAVILCNLISQYVLQRRQILEVGAKLEYSASRDALTGVYNRRYLTDTLKQWLAAGNNSFLTALIDVDDFKQINDTYGHVYGDEVLTELARLMEQEMEGKGIVARYGGEEFMLIFEKHERHEALESLERIKAGLASFSARTKKITITFSGGLEENGTCRELDTLFRSVDRKLYHAKNNGKNRIVADMTPICD